jgi:outer membrane murein-binding lipoprotein Lpp
MFDISSEGALTAVLDEFSSRIDALEARVEELDATVEQLRYEGPARAEVMHDDYDYYLEGEWDAL